MKEKGNIIQSQEFEIKLKKHEIAGGYIYIPIDVREKFKENLDGDVRLVGKGATFITKIKMDKNGRIYTVLSGNKISTLSDWFRTVDAAEGDFLKFSTERMEDRYRIVIEHFPSGYDNRTSLSSVSGAVGLYQLSKEIGFAGMAKIVTIFSTFEEILTRSLQKAYSPEQVCNVTIADCVSSIKTDPRLVMFFEEYWNSPDMRRLFSQRPVQLIRPAAEKTDEDGQIGQFQLCDIEDIENMDQAAIESIKQHQLSMLKSKYHLILERYSELKGIVEQLLSMVPANEEETQTSRKRKKRELNRILKFIQKSIEDEEIQEELEDLLVDVIKDPMTLFQSFIGAGLPEAISNVKSNIEHVVNVTGLTMKGYHESIGRLASYRLLTSAYRIYWCPHHHTEPFYTIVLTPTSKFKAICPNCDQQLKSMGGSFVDSRLFDFMRHKDGLMTIAMAWYFQKRNLKWEANKMVNGHEIDLVAHGADKDYYLEAKVLFNDNDPMAFKRKITEGLRKFEIKKKEIGGAGSNAKDEWLFIVNIPSEALAKFYVKSNEGIKIISVDDFIKTIEPK